MGRSVMSDMSPRSVDDLISDIKNEVQKLRTMCGDDSMAIKALEVGVSSPNTIVSVPSSARTTAPTSAPSSPPQMYQEDHCVETDFGRDRDTPTRRRSDRSHPDGDYLFTGARAESTANPRIRQFEVTLRKPDNKMLGLEVNKDNSRGDGSVIIGQIEDDGLVAMFNRQYPGSAIHQGDRIVGVNNYSAHSGANSQREILDECKRRRVVRLRLERDLDLMHRRPPAYDNRMTQRFPPMHLLPQARLSKKNKIPPAMKLMHPGASFSSMHEPQYLCQTLRAEADEFVPRVCNYAPNPWFGW